MGEYTILTTGDCVVGDDVLFKKDVWGGTFRNPKHLGYVHVEGKIIKDIYEESHGKHIFTLLTEDGRTLMIRGRNLYRYYVYRRPWCDESIRIEIAKEKHERGMRARTKYYLETLCNRKH